MMTFSDECNFLSWLTWRHSWCHGDLEIWCWYLEIWCWYLEIWCWYLETCIWRDWAVVCPNRFNEVLTIFLLQLRQHCINSAAAVYIQFIFTSLWLNQHVYSVDCRVYTPLQAVHFIVLHQEDTWHCALLQLNQHQIFLLLSSELFCTALKWTFLLSRMTLILSY